MKILHNNESLNGSHFFITTASEARYMFQAVKSEETYIEEFLDHHIRESVIRRFTIGNTPPYSECCEVFKLVKNQVFQYVQNHPVVIKIEFDPKKSHEQLIKFLINEGERPQDIKGLSHVANKVPAYYIYSNNNIDTTLLISSLVQEYTADD